MRNFFISMMLLGAAIAVGGCPKDGPNTGQSGTIVEPNTSGAGTIAPNAAEPNRPGPDMLIAVDGEFPDYMVGRWVADEDGWQFIIDPNGRITYARISMGRVWLKPGKTTDVPMKEGGQGLFQPGTWHLHFDKESRVLTIGITLKNLAINVPDNRLKGSSRDTFVGVVAEDNRTWEATWTSFPKYWAYTDEHPEGFYLGVDDPVYGAEKQLVFTKVPMDSRIAIDSQKKAGESTN